MWITSHACMQVDGGEWFERVGVVDVEDPSAVVCLDQVSKRSPISLSRKFRSVKKVEKNAVKSPLACCTILSRVRSVA